MDAGDGGVDLLDGGAGLGREGQVALALDGQGVALAGLLVELDVAGLAVLGERVGLGLQGLGLAQVVLPLGLEQRQLAAEEGVQRRLLLPPARPGAGPARLQAHRHWLTAHREHGAGLRRR